MDNVIKKLEDKINIDKEMLALLPRNNKKNIVKTLDKIEETKKIYEAWHEEIINEIEKRFQQIDKIQENPEIQKQQENLDNMNSAWLIMSDITTSYEKMELDKLVYGINGFYKKDLSTVNGYIFECIKRFEQRQIKLTADDFVYSEYAHEYMKAFFNGIKKGNVYSEEIKSTFEKLYLKCSDIITHIALNFRYLYHKNEKNIEKSFRLEKESILEKLNLSEKELNSKFEELKAQIKDIKSKDGRSILNRFLNGELIVNDYKEDNINSLCLKMKANDTKINDEFYINIRKLGNDLQELKMFYEYKFLVIDIKRIYGKQKTQDKTKNKKSDYDVRLEEISAAEKKLFQLNANVDTKTNKMFFWKRKNGNKQMQTLERNNKILEIRDLYRKLDDDMINKTISEKITDASSILDILFFAASYYNFIARDIIKHFPEIVESDINKLIDKLKEFIKNKRFEVINNINITEEKDIGIIIKDKYKLFGLNVNKEDLNEANLDSIINTVNTIVISKDIENTQISIDDIEFMYKANNLLKE